MSKYLIIICVIFVSTLVICNCGSYPKHVDDHNQDHELVNGVRANPLHENKKREDNQHLDHKNHDGVKKPPVDSHDLEGDEHKTQHDDYHQGEKGGKHEDSQHDHKAVHHLELDLIKHLQNDDHKDHKDVKRNNDYTLPIPDYEQNQNVKDHECIVVHFEDSRDDYKVTQSPGAYPNKEATDYHHQDVKGLLPDYLKPSYGQPKDDYDHHSEHKTLKNKKPGFIDDKKDDNKGDVHNELHVIKDLQKDDHNVHKGFKRHDGHTHEHDLNKKDHESVKGYQKDSEKDLKLVDQHPLFLVKELFIPNHEHDQNKKDKKDVKGNQKDSEDDHKPVHHGFYLVKELQNEDHKDLTEVKPILDHEDDQNKKDHEGSNGYQKDSEHEYKTAQHDQLYQVKELQNDDHKDLKEVKLILDHEHDLNKKDPEVIKNYPKDSQHDNKPAQLHEFYLIKELQNDNHKHHKEVKLNDEYTLHLPNHEQEKNKKHHENHLEDAQDAYKVAESHEAYPNKEGKDDHHQDLKVHARNTPDDFKSSHDHKQPKNEKRDDDHNVDQEAVKNKKSWDIGNKDKKDDHNGEKEHHSDSKPITESHEQHHNKKLIEDDHQNHKDVKDQNKDFAVVCTPEPHHNDHHDDEEHKEVKRHKEESHEVDKSVQEHEHSHSMELEDEHYYHLDVLDPFEDIFI